MSYSKCAASAVFVVSLFQASYIFAETGSYADRGYSNSSNTGNKNSNSGNKNTGNNPGNPNASGYNGGGNKNTGSSTGYGGGNKNTGNNPGNPNASGYNGGGNQSTSNSTGYGGGSSNGYSNTGNNPGNRNAPGYQGSTGGNTSSGRATSNGTSTDLSGFHPERNTEMGGNINREAGLRGIEAASKATNGKSMSAPGGMFNAPANPQIAAQRQSAMKNRQDWMSAYYNDVQKTYAKANTPADQRALTAGPMEGVALAAQAKGMSVTSEEKAIMNMIDDQVRAGKLQGFVPGELAGVYAEDIAGVYGAMSPAAKLGALTSVTVVGPPAEVTKVRQQYGDLSLDMGQTYAGVFQGIAIGGLVTIQEIPLDPKNPFSGPKGTVDRTVHEWNHAGEFAVAVSALGKSNKPGLEGKLAQDAYAAALASLTSSVDQVADLSAKVNSGAISFNSWMDLKTDAYLQNISEFRAFRSQPNYKDAWAEELTTTTPISKADATALADVIAADPAMKALDKTINDYATSMLGGKK